MKNELENLLDRDVEIFKESDLKLSGRQIWQIYVVEGGFIDHQFDYDTEAERDADFNDALEYLNEYYGNTSSKGA